MASTLEYAADKLWTLYQLLQLAIFIFQWKIKKHESPATWLWATYMLGLLCRTIANWLQHKPEENKVAWNTAKQLKLCTSNAAQLSHIIKDCCTGTPACESCNLRATCWRLQSNKARTTGVSWKFISQCQQRCQNSISSAQGVVVISHACHSAVEESWGTSWWCPGTVWQMPRCIDPGQTLHIQNSTLSGTRPSTHLHMQ